MKYHQFCVLGNPVVTDFMATLIPTSAITLAWSPPTAVVPISYNINRRCRRVCESSITSNSETSVSSPHTSTGIPPYSQCGFDLIGVYGAEIAYLKTNYLTNTLSTGKITNNKTAFYFLYSPYCTSE